MANAASDAWDLLFFLLRYFVTVGAIAATVSGSIAFFRLGHEAYWSPTIWRAQRARRRVLNGRIVALMATGHPLERAQLLAERELVKQAED